MLKKGQNDPSLDYMLPIKKKGRIFVQDAITPCFLPKKNLIQEAVGQVFGMSYRHQVLKYTQIIVSVCTE